jgi:threonine/homoserine/homoserine lactone efflux protein
LNAECYADFRKSCFKGERTLVDGTRFMLFMSAATLLAVSPGPGMLYVLSRMLHGGRREGFLSAGGTFVGGLVHAVAAGLGLSAILMRSALAFEIVRYAGAWYLIYLGVPMIRNRRARLIALSGESKSRQSFLQGITTEVLNPKTALFFLSFIPQFVSPAKGHVVLQFLIFGTISVILNTAPDFLVVGFAGSLAQRVAHRQQLIERQRAVSGAGMIGLGIYVASSKWSKNLRMEHMNKRGAREQGEGVCDFLNANNGGL